MKNLFNYYTQDGHLMIEGETMWRICCSRGILFSEPLKCNFSQNTAYNGNIEKINENHFELKSRSNLNPYSANHLHYYDYNNAMKELNKRTNK